MAVQMDYYRFSVVILGAWNHSTFLCFPLYISERTVYEEQMKRMRDKFVCVVGWINYRFSFFLVDFGQKVVHECGEVYEANAWYFVGQQWIFVVG